MSVNIDYVVARIMGNSPAESVPCPSALNEELEVVLELIKLHRKELNNTLDDVDKKTILDIINDRVRKFQYQVVKENAPSRGHKKVIHLSNKLELDILSAGQDSASVSVTMLTFVAIKLCFIADLARIDSVSEPEEFAYFLSKKNTDRMGLFFSAEFPKKRSMSFHEFAQTPLKHLMIYAGSLPIIPIINFNGRYGVLTYLYAFFRGYLLVGFPIENSADVHGGLLKSFASFYRMAEATDPNYPLDLNKLNFESSVMGMIHDLFHLEELLCFVNPVLRRDLRGEDFYYDENEIVDAKKWFVALGESYSLLVESWPNNDSQDQVDTYIAASYFLFWLLHEHSIGVEKISPKLCVDEYVRCEKYYDLLFRSFLSNNFNYAHLSEHNLKERIWIIFLSNDRDFAKEFKTLPTFQHLFNCEESEIDQQLQSVKLIFDKVLETLPEVFRPLKSAASLFGDRIEFSLIVPQSTTAPKPVPNHYLLSDEEQTKPFVVKIFECDRGIVQETKISSFYPREVSVLKEYIDKLDELKFCYVLFIKEKESKTKYAYNSNTIDKIAEIWRNLASKDFYVRVIVIKDTVRSSLYATLFDDDKPLKGIAVRK